jgi:hypothetical protein
METSNEWSPEVYTPTPQSLQIKALFYGRPGAGKSTLAATASTVKEMLPVLYINAESGIMSISENWDGRIDTAQLKILDFTGYKQLNQLFEYLAFKPHQYKTIVLDSLTELQAFVVNKFKDHYIPKTEEGVAIDENQDKKMTLKVYERATDTMRNICRKFRDLPMHVIMVCHDDTSDVNGTIVTHPALTPKFRDSIVGYMDIVGFLTTRETNKDNEKEIERLVTFIPTPKRIAKDRSPGGKLDSILIDPTMQKIWDKLTKEK